MPSILCIPNSPTLETGLHAVSAELFAEAKYLPHTEELEADESVRQVIPYCVCWHRGRILVYRRKGREGRLKDLRSLGIGGHIEERDRAQTVLFTARIAAARELKEEIGVSPIWLTCPLKIIVDNSNAVGRVHIGLLCHAALTDFDFDHIKTESAIGELVAVNPKHIDPEGLENWSRLVLEWTLARQERLAV